jgi:hypothetical protein
LAVAAPNGIGDTARRWRVADTGRRVGLVVLAVAAFLLVANFARIGVDKTRSRLEHDSVAQADQAFDTYRCVQSKIDRRVPAGSPIAVTSTDPLWLERGREGSYPRYDVTTQARAAYVVTVVPHGDTCDLIDVRVARTP